MTELSSLTTPPTPGRARRRRWLAPALLAVVALGASACRAESSSTSAEPTGSAAAPISASDPGTFGDLNDVCQKGTAKGATAQGVTDTQIQVGTITDFGFTKGPEFIDAAEVFTKWCNEAGGINGRQVVSKTRDTKIAEYRQRILEACSEDFMLVGGSGAFDSTGVKDRLNCLLPEIAPQAVSLENTGSDLQILPGQNRNLTVHEYEGYFNWLVNTKFPDSKQSVGFIVGDVGMVKTLGDQSAEVFNYLGANVVYNDVYPMTGVSDWTPYAQAIKSAGVKGLVFFGDFKELAKLEQALTDTGHQLSWIDTNSNAYNPQFIELAGSVLDSQPNYSTPTVAQFDSDNPAMKQLQDLYKKYKPDAKLTKPAVNAMAAWLLFAVAARDCGSDLTRSCVLEKASAIKDFDGGGLIPPNDLSSTTSKEVCFNVAKATADGWVTEEIETTDGDYRCEEAKMTISGNYAKPVTLADVGKTASDLK